MGLPGFDDAPSGQPHQAAGKVWGGSQKGRRLKMTGEAIATTCHMNADGESKTAVAQATGLSRPTAYAVFASNGAG